MQLIINNALHTLTATFPQQTRAANGRVLSRGAGLMCLLAILSLFYVITISYYIILSVRLVVGTTHTLY